MHVNKVNLQPFIPRSAANDIIRSRSFRLDRPRRICVQAREN